MSRIVQYGDWVGLPYDCNEDEAVSHAELKQDTIDYLKENIRAKAKGTILEDTWEVVHRKHSDDPFIDVIVDTLAVKVMVDVGEEGEA